MSLKAKMSLGLGFLFLIILVLTGSYSYHINKLSREAGNILKDNYASIVYSKNMMLAIEDMQSSITNGLFNPDTDTPGSYRSKLFASGKMEFEKNLNAEKNNITEIHEFEYVEVLAANYEIYLNLCDQIQKGIDSKPAYFNELMPVYEKLRQTITSIGNINMEAVERKNLLTKQDAANIIRNSAIIGTILLLLAFGYFWYFPFYVSSSLSYLSERMKGLLKKASINAEFKTEDEAQILLQAINLLENKFSAEK